MKLKVFRFNGEMDSPRYDTYEIDETPGLTVLGALFQIQEKHDDSLSFRYSCRGAVCGTCAMLINKVPRLACRSQLLPLLKGELKIDITPYPAIEKETTSWNQKEEILVEPLPHLPVIKDLIVDLDKFFEYYEFVEPFFKPKDEAPPKERLMDPNSIPQLEIYTNCILCAACFGACPVDGKNPDYLGPAALAKLYRFYIDPREGRRIQRLEIADVPQGWWPCEFFGNCMQVCPKGVTPTNAISIARMKLENKKELK